MKYQAIIEKTQTGYSAYIPDLPGCVATGRTIVLVFKRLKSAADMHIQGMIEDGEAIPEPSTAVREIELVI